MLFYRLLVRLSRLVGLWLVRWVAAIVSASYFVFLPARRSASVEFYRALFPGESRRRALARTWHQYQDFARLYSDRLEIERRTDIRYEWVGKHHLAEANEGGRGVILVMSHVGRWEIGARLLGRMQHGVTVVMGGEADGGTRGGVDRNLRNAGVNVVTVPAGQGQPFDILEALKILRDGGMVSLAADRAFGDARVLRMPFLGRTVGVAAAPFALALSSGAPLLVVFAVRVAARHYRFICEDPVVLTADSRRERQAAMEKGAAFYLEKLHALVTTYPEQWQTFGRFFLN